MGTHGLKRRTASLRAFKLKDEEGKGRQSWEEIRYRYMQHNYQIYICNNGTQMTAQL